MSGCRTIRLSDHQTSDYQTVRLSECQTIKLSDCPIVRLSDCQTIRLSECQTIRMSDFPTIRLSECPKVKLSDCQTQMQSGISSSRDSQNLCFSLGSLHLASRFEIEERKCSSFTAVYYLSCKPKRDLCIILRQVPPECLQIRQPLRLQPWWRLWPQLW
jgi:hypothetical protein